MTGCAAPESSQSIVLLPAAIHVKQFTAVDMTTRTLSLIKNPVEEKVSHRHDGETAANAATVSVDEIPNFQHHQETSNIQLFFDLFFVANLTSFTEEHEVNNSKSLSSYIGFFSILWFTWFQVTMYDVRFSTDSILERTAHGCHLGVMVGLAVIGPQYGGTDTVNGSVLQTLSLIFMVNRLVLVVQYCSTLCFVWRYPMARRPLLLIAGSLFLTAMIFLGTSFAYSGIASHKAFISWYFCSFFEIAANAAVARRWKVVSFKGTHIVERMSCLTLIILGEGVISLARSIVKIISLDNNFSSAAVGSITSAVLIIYVIYMLYFDTVVCDFEKGYRHGIWILLHLPFHICLVLLMEGISQILSWQHIVDYLNTVFSQLLYDSENQDSVSLLMFQQDWNDTINAIVDTLGASPTVYINIQSDLQNLSPTANITDEERQAIGNSLQIEMFKIVFDGYGFSVPESEPTNDLGQALDSYGSVFNLLFGYFFVCSGLALIFIAILSYLSIVDFEEGEERQQVLRRLPSNVVKRPLRFIGILAETLLGIGLCLLSIMTVTGTAEVMGETSWTLALLVFVLLIVLVITAVPRGLSIVGKSESTGDEPGQKKSTRPERIGTGF